MPFTTVLDTFVNNLNASLEEPLDGQFLELIRTKATEVFEPVWNSANNSQVAGAPVVVGKVKAKKAPSAYNFFLKDYSSKHPGTQNLMKVVGAAWGEMDDEAKTPFVKMAEEAKAAKVAATPVQVAGAGVGAVVEPKIAKKPRGPSGYNVYVSETRNKDVSMKQVGAMWKALSEDEQQVFKDKAKAQAPAPAEAEAEA